MMGFFMVLLAVGGLGSLVALADRPRARLFPFTMAMLFLSLGAWVLRSAFGYFGEVIGERTGDTLAFLGIPIGALGGAMLGSVIGMLRNRRLGIN